MAHELARVIADQAGATFALPWLKDAFANYALVAVLGETDPAGAASRGHARGSDARRSSRSTPHASKLGAPAQALAVRGGARAARARRARRTSRMPSAGDAPLARWFAAAHAKRGPSDRRRRDLARMLPRDVHPAIGALAAAWHDDIAHAA